MIDDLRHRVVQILMQRSDGITFVVSVAAFLLSVGFFSYDTPYVSAYEVLSRLMPLHLWGLFFLVYGVAKAINLFFVNCLYLTVSVSAVGIWAWNYLFLSFTVFDVAPPHPAELLIFLPVLCEVWSLVSIIYAKRE